MESWTTHNTIQVTFIAVEGAKAATSSGSLLLLPSFDTTDTEKEAALFLNLGL